MVTVLRHGRFRFVIYLNDHEPAHVHVFASGSEAKVNVHPAGTGGELVRQQGMKSGEIRDMMKVVREKAPFLLKEWERIHGRDH